MNIAKKIQQGVNKTLGNQMLASREKYWKELKADEKVERMRTVVKRLEERIENLKQSEALLMRHSHTEDGSVVVVNHLGNRYGGEEVSNYPHNNRPGMNPDEVYF